MASNMWAQQPMLTQNNRSACHKSSGISEEQFNSPRLQHVGRARCETPPPAPRRAKPPPLLMALAKNDLVKVCSCLKEDANAATDPFWDHDVEPPLCAAVRLRCDARIIKALLDSDANPEAVDSHGQTPLQIGASLGSSTPEPDLYAHAFLTLFPPFAARTQDQLRHIQGTAEARVEPDAFALSAMPSGVIAATKQNDAN
mmetsp:Transcript_32406/g.63802  ORF Transcript_32406/g.63802 Transcript_32406/m.63802 type:complete len:200 (+) Transcript_32406:117-716(+)